jgi:hypothetical protein
MRAKAASATNLYLFAAILLAISVQMPRVSLAEDAGNQGGAVTPTPSGDAADHATEPGDSGSTKINTLPTKSDSAKPDAPSMSSGHEVGGSSSGAHAGATVNENSHSAPSHDAAPIDARNSAPIDARIAPPARHKDNRFSARGAKNGFKIVGSSSRRTAPGHMTNHVTRNSIGLAIPSQPKPDHDNKPAVPVIAPAAGTPGVSTGGTVTAIKTGPTVEHPFVARPNVSAPVAINGSAIGGNANIRRNSGPASLGGQTKTVAGINGSTIVRRVH